MLTVQPSTDGFIAVLLTHFSDHEREMNKLLTDAQYKNVLLQRKTKLDINADVAPSEEKLKCDIETASAEGLLVSTDLASVDEGCKCEEASAAAAAADTVIVSATDVGLVSVEGQC